MFEEVCQRSECTSVSGRVLEREKQRQRRKNMQRTMWHCEEQEVAQAEEEDGADRKALDMRTPTGNFAWHEFGAFLRSFNWRNFR